VKRQDDRSHQGNDSDRDGPHGGVEPPVSSDIDPCSDIQEPRTPDRPDNRAGEYRLPIKGRCGQRESRAPGREGMGRQKYLTKFRRCIIGVAAKWYLSSCQLIDLGKLGRHNRRLAV